MTLPRLEPQMENRRAFLSDLGMGFTGMALGAMLWNDGVARGEAPSPVLAPFPVKAKRVIWLFMVGGASQMETFDPKPALDKYGGKTFSETPYQDILKSPKLNENLREVVVGLHHSHQKLLPLQIPFRKRGQAGIEVSDWWPHTGSMVDDIAFVRSMWTTDNNHGAQLQFHTGRHVLDGFLPTIGSWASYGLGTLNEELPQFVVLGTPIADCCGGVGAHGAGYLGPEHDGVELNIAAPEPIPFIARHPEVSADDQKAQFDLLGKLNRITAVEYPNDPALRARIKAYELAYRMQAAAPDALRLPAESSAIQSLYGLDDSVTAPFGQQLLAARRLAERGVRFIQVFHGSNGGAGAWDAHGGLKAGHANLCRQTDKPIAGLLKDLKQRGMLEETLVVWCTEFGRTPGAQGADGRDHHPFGFTVWLAGGGVKGGVVHGATDELGFHAVENRHYVTDIHATVLRLMGLDSRQLNIPGRKRLELEYGHPILDILA